MATDLIARGLAVKNKKDVGTLSEDINDLANKVTPLTKGRLYTDFSDFTMWYGDVTHVTEHVIVGDTSLRMTTDSDNYSSASRMQNTGLVLSRIQNLMIRLYIDNHDLLSYVRFRFFKDDNNYAQWELRRLKSVAGWNEIPIYVGDLVITGEWSLDDEIDYIQINVAGDNTGTEHTVVTLDSIYLNRTVRPRVILHFDDARLSQFTNAFPIMRARGLVGCIGVCSDVIGSSGSMNEGDLKTLYNHGWELFNHSTAHRILTTLSKEEIRQEVMGCKEWLDNRGYTQSSDILAYPDGYYNDDVLDVIKDFRIGRTVVEGHEVSIINPYRIKVIIILNETTVEEAIEVVDKAIASSSTVIFLFHKIEDSGTDDMTWHTDRFEQLINYLDEKRNEIDVVTTDEWIRSQ